MVFRAWDRHVDLHSTTAHAVDTIDTVQADVFSPGARGGMRRTADSDLPLIAEALAGLLDRPVTLMRIQAYQPSVSAEIEKLYAGNPFGHY